VESRKYGWGGLKAPLLNRDDPDYCEYGCPVCRAARKGSRLGKVLQAIETALTFGGCWWGRARQRKYGVKPDEPLPETRPGSGSEEGRGSPE
jgi:hypothetical protein